MPSNKRQKRVHAVYEEAQERLEELQASQQLANRADAELFTLDTVGSKQVKKRLAAENDNIIPTSSNTERVLIEKMIVKLSENKSNTKSAKESKSVTVGGFRCFGGAEKRENC